MDPGADSAWLGGADGRRRYTSRHARHVLTRCESESCASEQARQCWRSRTSTEAFARLYARTRQLWSVIEAHLLRVLPVTRSTDGEQASAFVALAIPTPTKRASTYMDLMRGLTASMQTRQLCRHGRSSCLDLSRRACFGHGCARRLCMRHGCDLEAVWRPDDVVDRRTPTDRAVL